MNDDRKCMWCPLMKEVCVEGWTKSMGEDEKTGERSKCRWWTVIKGKLPQADEMVEKGDCSISWEPVINLETNQRILGATAAIESLRNSLSSMIQSDNTEVQKDK